MSKVVVVTGVNACIEHDLVPHLYVLENELVHGLEVPLVVSQALHYTACTTRSAHRHVGLQLKQGHC